MLPAARGSWAGRCRGALPGSPAAAQPCPARPGPALRTRFLPQAPPLARRRQKKVGPWRREGSSGPCSSPPLLSSLSHAPAALLPCPGGDPGAAPRQSQKFESRRWQEALAEVAELQSCTSICRQAGCAYRHACPHLFSLAHQNAQHCWLLFSTCHLLASSQNQHPLGDTLRPFEFSMEATLKTTDCTCSRYHGIEVY